MPRLHSLQPGMENVNRPVAKIFWCARFSPWMMEKLRCVCVYGEMVGRYVGKQTNTHALTHALQPLPLCVAMVCTCSMPAMLMHRPHSRSAFSHFKQPISQPWLSAAPASRMCSAGRKYCHWELAGGPFVLE